MISKTQAYASSTGAIFATLEEAQRDELVALFSAESGLNWTPDEIAERIIEQSARILDILSTTKRSRPARRLVNGYKGRKQGRAAAPPVAASETAAA